MRPNGINIRIYLIDGTADGLKTAEIMNWTGHMISAPRTELPRFLTRPEMKKTGIYVLSGTDPENPDKKKVYIGESDNVGSRLKQHDANESKDFWEDTLAVVSKDNNLTKSHVRYLEARMIEMANAARRATIVNGNSPVSSNFLPEAEEADMEFFLAQVIMLLPVLGLDFATRTPVVPTRASPPSTAQENGMSHQPSPIVSVPQTSPRFELTSVGVHAVAQQVGPKFIVLKGATAVKNVVPSFPIHCKSYWRIREALCSDGKLVNSDNDKLLVAEDIPFNGPSAAAAVLGGFSANGKTLWKVADTGITYREWQNSQFPPDDPTMQSEEDGTNL